jgi:hypothetical protein
MNLGEFKRTEEFPMVVPERVQPITIPEKMPCKEPVSIPEKERECAASSSLRIGEGTCQP